MPCNWVIRSLKNSPGVATGGGGGGGGLRGMVRIEIDSFCSRRGVLHFLCAL